ncbi:hypothetical protein BH789_gp065 [Gordonia phage GMA6]|uniref:Uncharacterized protein n=1 Tax=Gordonia phage GMA6 TaxID=1647285 RepID=A0A0K0NKT5_9CAUD|nr:hypothetical protein BH789_gp065 [Gordonia phage GMA6]AKL88346.1 hypothetical protein GMA6_65 [Gordonia phage GMA6]
MPEDIIDQIDVRFEHCRIYGHMWDSMTITFLEGRQYLDHLRCERCGTERRDKVNLLNGLTVSRAYTYTVGYKLKNGGWDAAARGRLRMRAYEKRTAL